MAETIATTLPTAATRAIEKMLFQREDTPEKQQPLHLEGLMAAERPW